MKTRRILVASAVAVVGSVALLSCGSISKDDVERTLLALPKNAGFRAAGLQRTAMTIPLEGVPTEVEVTWLEIPRQSATAGEATRPIVLVHGTPGSLFTWAETVCGTQDGSSAAAANGLAQEHDVYAFDVLGHGMTRTEDRPVTFQKCADWVAGVVKELGIGPVHLVGQSYGGEFCWRAAVDHPDLFRTVTLLDSAGYTRPADGWLPEEVAMREMWLAPIGWAVLDREKMRAALDIHFPAPVSADRVEEYYTASVHSGNWKAMVDLCRDENGTREGDIAKLSMPVHLVWGADDIAYPVESVGKRFANDIAKSELLVIPGCGHYPHETVPALLATKMRDFYRRNP